MKSFNRTIICTLLLELVALHCAPLHAMHQLILPQYDLQKEFGYKQYAKRLGEAKAQTEYAKKLQILASALVMQEQLIERTYAYVDAQSALDKAYAKSRECTPENATAVGPDKKKSYFVPKTSEALAIALRYRDLLRDPSLANSLPQETLLTIIATLKNYNDPDLDYLAKVIEANYMVDTAKTREANTLKDVEQLLSVIANNSMPYLEQVRANAQEETSARALKLFDSFILNHVSMLWEIPQVYMAAFTQNFGTRGIKVYFQNRRDIFLQEKNTQKTLYDAVITELNTLIQKQPTTCSMNAYRLEAPVEVLPGINTDTLSKHTYAQDTLDTLVAELELQQQATTSTKKDSKQKNQRPNAAIATPAPSTTSASTNTDEIDAPPVQLNTDSLFQTASQASSSYTAQATGDNTADDTNAYSTPTATQKKLLTPLQPGETLFQEFPGALGSRLCVYTTLPGNAADYAISPFTLAPNVCQWLSDPLQALEDQRYYYESSSEQAAKNKQSKYKYQRAKEYYSQRYSDNNDKTMRMHMRIFHTLPREIDTYITRYGQVTEQKSRLHRNQTHICITIPGEVIFANGVRQQGLFSYVINKESNVCFHRMFEPKELSTQIMNPTVLDLDMSAVDE